MHICCEKQYNEKAEKILYGKKYNKKIKTVENNNGIVSLSHSVLEE